MPAPASSASKMTYDQLCLLPEDRQRHELFDGELVMTPSPSHRHQAIVVRLTTALDGFVKTHALGRVYVAPLDIVFEPHTVLQPDVLFIRQGRLGILGEEVVEGAPDLVVEVLSPSTFYNDLRRKMAAYARFGVQEYWIVDPEKQAVELYSLAAEHWQLRHSFSADETLESPLLPGLRLPVRSIFE
ncbi:MAG: Uma2 family endonuclease [Acidobacteria bacterium]|nr:Uma2 family endonuclease [Acidobacteriota bacterium]